MNQTLSKSQLSQTIAKIEVVQCPLESSLQFTRMNQVGITFINNLREWFKESFLFHYAIILNTTENEQFILHNLRKGFTSSIITNQQRLEECYQMIETYNSPQFDKQFTVQEIYDINQIYHQYQQQYDLLKNNCIHYVNHVKEYMNRFLLDIDAHATKKIDSHDLFAMAKILIRNIYQNIALKKIMQFPKEFIKNRSLYYNILDVAILCAKNLTKKQIFGISVLIAIIFILIEIPLINLNLTIPAIIQELHFIFVQIDKGYFQKCIESLHRLFYVYFKTILISVASHYLFNLCSDLIKEFRIEPTKTNVIVIIGGFTVAGIIGGVYFWKTMMIISAPLSMVSTDLCVKGILSAVAAPIVICAAIGALVGIGICMWFGRK